MCRFEGAAYYYYTLAMETLKVRLQLPLMDSFPFSSAALPALTMQSQSQSQSQSFICCLHLQEIKTPTANMSLQDRQLLERFADLYDKAEVG